MSNNLGSPFHGRPKRNPFSPYQHCYWEDYFRGYRLRQKTEYGPLILEYLVSSFELIKALQYQHSKVFGFRFDLRFPADSETPLDYEKNTVMGIFRSNLQRELNKAKKKNSTKLNLIWARERKSAQWVKGRRKRHGKELNADDTKPHYHALILLNGNSFDWIGSYKPTANTDGLYQDDTMAHRVIRSWSQALGERHHQKMPGLVHFCEGYRFEEVPAKDGRSAKIRRIKEITTYNIKREDGPKALVEVMYAASYLCKAYSKDVSKNVSQRTRCFQTTQIDPDILNAVWNEEKAKGEIISSYGTPLILRQSVNDETTEGEDEDIDFDYYP